MGEQHKALLAAQTEGEQIPRLPEMAEDIGQDLRIIVDEGMDD